MELIHRGKVRDVYADGPDELLLVATDRVSVYDVVLPTPIPGKGAVLTALSTWWFDQVADLVPHHVVSTVDVPREFAGRAMRCRRLDIVPVECIVRGYLTGLGLREYEASGSVSGVPLPEGLGQASRLPEPIFTPTTKATEGHDEFITFAQVVDEVGAELAARLRDTSLAVYRRAAETAARAGLVLADTKFEFGIDADGRLVLADEVCTPDSSRYWRIDDWNPPGQPTAYDKQYFRDWSATVSDWDRTPPGPPIPADVVEEGTRRYVWIYEALTGARWTGAAVTPAAPQLT